MISMGVVIFEALDQFVVWIEFLKTLKQLLR
jgi:hypothetical protein